MKQVYIVAGGNGCGKTTFAHELLNDYSLKFINADEIASKLGDFDKHKIQAGKEFLKLIDDHIKNGNSFIMETTLSGKYVQALVKKLKSKEYSVTLLYVFVESVELSLSRIKLRVLKGGHNIPEVDVRRRLRRSLDNFNNLYKKLVDNWELHYNGENGFTLVAVGNNNNISVKDEELLKKFKNYND